MGKFRKKPVVIEAEQFDGSVESCERLIQLYSSDVWPEFGYTEETHTTWTGRLVVQTFEGRTFAEPGDWIITGTRGERYPCKPDIFAAIYESVDA